MVWPDNADAFKIWLLVRDQVDRAGMAGEMMAIRHDAVWKAIEMYQIHNPTECFEKVLKIFYEVQIKKTEEE